jgi:sulfite oxidase
VYDISPFLASHPGGQEKIVLACGRNVEEFWNLYRQHYDSEQPQEVLDGLGCKGIIPEAELASTKVDPSNPYAADPARSPALKQHTQTPCNAETPTGLLTHDWITPNALFYVRAKSGRARQQAPSLARVERVGGAGDTSAPANCVSCASEAGGRSG